MPDADRNPHRPPMSDRSRKPTELPLSFGLAHVGFVSTSSVLHLPPSCRASLHHHWVGVAWDGACDGGRCHPSHEGVGPPASGDPLKVSHDSIRASCGRNNGHKGRSELSNLTGNEPALRSHRAASSLWEERRVSTSRGVPSATSIDFRLSRACSGFGMGHTLWPKEVVHTMPFGVVAMCS